MTQQQDCNVWIIPAREGFSMKAEKNYFSRNVSKKILIAKYAVGWTPAHLNDPLLHITKIPMKKKKIWERSYERIWFRFFFFLVLGGFKHDPFQGPLEKSQASESSKNTAWDVRYPETQIATGKKVQEKLKFLPLTTVPILLQRQSLLPFTNPR